MLNLILSTNKKSYFFSSYGKIMNKSFNGLDMEEK